MSSLEEVVDYGSMARSDSPQPGPSEPPALPEVLRQCSIECFTHANELPLEYRVFTHLVPEDQGTRFLARSQASQPVDLVRRDKARVAVASFLAAWSEADPTTFFQIRDLVRNNPVRPDGYDCQQWVALGHLLVFRFADFAATDPLEAAQNILTINQIAVSPTTVWPAQLQSISTVPRLDRLLTKPPSADSRVSWVSELHVADQALVNPGYREAEPPATAARENSAAAPGVSKPRNKPGKDQRARRRARAPTGSSSSSSLSSSSSSSSSGGGKSSSSSSSSGSGRGIAPAAPRKSARAAPAADDAVRKATEWVLDSPANLQSFRDYSSGSLLTAIPPSPLRHLSLAQLHAVLTDGRVQRWLGQARKRKSTPTSAPQQSKANFKKQKGNGNASRPVQTSAGRPQNPHKSLVAEKPQHRDNKGIKGPVPSDAELHSLRQRAALSIKGADGTMYPNRAYRIYAKRDCVKNGLCFGCFKPMSSHDRGACPNPEFQKEP